MTREEAKEIIEEIKYKTCSRKYVTAQNEALDIAIKALEQKPCEDAISRQAVLDIINNPLNIRLDEIIKRLPSVRPQEPFMNKPCVAHQVCHEDKVKVLDKIRAEIEQTFLDNGAIRAGMSTALNIIDKYRESEESDANSN